MLTYDIALHPGGDRSRMTGLARTAVWNLSSLASTSDYGWALFDRDPANVAGNGPGHPAVPVAYGVLRNFDRDRGAVELGFQVTSAHRRLHRARGIRHHWPDPLPFVGGSSVPRQLDTVIRSEAAVLGIALDDVIATMEQRGATHLSTRAFAQWLGLVRRMRIAAS